MERSREPMDKNRINALVEDETTPLMERIKFAGIMGMHYDEFAMKRLGGLCQRIAKASQRHPARME